MSTDSPSHPGPSLGAVQELRTLAAALHGVDAAAAAACSREPRLRGLLSREMVAYRAS